MCQSIFAKWYRFRKFYKIKIQFNKKFRIFFNLKKGSIARKINCVGNLTTKTITKRCGNLLETSEKAENTSKIVSTNDSFSIIVASSLTTFYTKSLDFRRWKKVAHGRINL